MHIGLIGGIGPAATDFYYRQLIKASAARALDLELTIVHADAPTLLGNLDTDNVTAQVDIYLKLTKRLEAAGAECVVVTSIAGHFCIDAFAEASRLPIIDITMALSQWLAENGLVRVGILGTKTVMQSAMYGKLAPVEVLVPKGEGLDEVHEAYVTLAQSGQPTAALKAVFERAGGALVKDGAQAVLLGGTDLNALLELHL